MSDINSRPKTKNKPRGLLFIALGMACITLCLGVWQLYRLQWKLDLISQRQAALTQPPINEAEFLAIQNPNLKFRPIQLEGSFDLSKEIIIYPRTHDDKPGYVIYTAFQTKAGHWFLVQRGWQSSLTNIPQPSSGPLHIEGLLLQPTQPKYALSERDMAQKTWPWLDFKMLEQKWSVTWASPFIVALEKTDPLLVALGAGPAYRNMHLSYAITWFSLSFFLLIFYFIYRKR